MTFESDFTTHRRYAKRSMDFWSRADGRIPQIEIEAVRPLCLFDFRPLV